MVKMVLAKFKLGNLKLCVILAHVLTAIGRF